MKLSISIVAALAVPAATDPLTGNVLFNRAVVPVAIPDTPLGVAYLPHKIATVAKPDKKKFLVDEATEVKLGDGR